MPDFGHPFSGLAKDRKLTESELIRAIRFMISAEEKFYAEGAQEAEEEIEIIKNH